MSDGGVSNTTQRNTQWSLEALNDTPRIDQMAQVKSLLLAAEERGFSDLFIRTRQPVIAQIDGELVPLIERRLEGDEVQLITQTIFRDPEASTTVLRGRERSGSFEFKEGRQRYRYRLMAVACRVDAMDGIDITVRTIPAIPPAFEDLMVEDAVKENFAPEQGVILITGETGSGKSTLLASGIRSLASDPQHRRILTIEEPIEFIYDDVRSPNVLITQSEVPRHTDSFAAGLRSALRRAPDVILVGEARDAETMAAVAAAANTGHLVYATLHANSPAKAIYRVINEFPPEERRTRMMDLIESIQMIVTQRLVKRVGGGRVALREFLVFDETVRTELMKVEPESLLAEAKRLLFERGQTMAADAQGKFDQGLIDEATRDRYVAEVS